MSLFERDHRRHSGPSGDAPGDPSVAPGSNSDAEDSAAHIAELVRRTAERQARPDAPAPARPDATLAQPPMPPPPPVQRAAPPAGPAPRAARRLPSPRLLIAVGAAAALLLVGVFALTRLGSLQATPTAPVQSTSAPALYTVQVTDTITDCVTHSHGKTKTMFKKENCVKATRFLATGQVSGRPAVFVLSRIQMASAEAAASVKQVLDATGTGNLNDLLREGKTFEGAPGTMPASGYASVQTGQVVVVAEAGFIDGPSASANPALRAAASRAAAQVTTQR